jgi:hypothetical protein
MSLRKTRPWAARSIVVPHIALWQADTIPLTGETGTACTCAVVMCQKVLNYALQLMHDGVAVQCEGYCAALVHRDCCICCWHGWCTRSKRWIADPVLWLAHPTSHMRPSDLAILIPSPPASAPSSMFLPLSTSA